MRILIDGQEYEFPTIDSITWDESILVERVSGHGLEELVEGESLPMGAVKAFVMVAVMRERPEVSEREISEAIGKIKLTEMQDMVQPDEPGTDADNPPSAPLGAEASTTTSGDDSSNGSDHRAAAPQNGSGSPRTGTGAISDPPTSVG